MAAALALLLAIGLAFWFRRPGLTVSTTVLGGLGLALLAVAAGLPSWNRPTPGSVGVMVDLSPSTRTATYRDRALLDRRVHQLLGDLPYRISYFSDHATDSAAGANVLSDMPCERTVYAAPGAEAVLLFSDCRFELPTQTPPTYVVRDPALDDVGDASISALEIRGAEANIRISNQAKPRGVSLRGVAGSSLTTAAPGLISIVRQVSAGAHTVAAELTPGDAWPENDALAANVPTAEHAERWWVGAGNTAPSQDWRTINPGDLPVDSLAYLAPAVIVLNNVPASELTEIQQQHLTQYVRDVGGALVILGGDHAFGAGGYPGTALETLSPLASGPPEPTTHWVILVDGSGSMSGAAAAGSTRWQLATGAAAGLIPHLPTGDLVSVGMFAESVTWWIESKPVRDAMTVPIPAKDAFPHGPTNLQAALEAIAKPEAGGMPVQLLVVSDFDASISAADDLEKRLQSKGVRVHVLAIGEGSALDVMKHITAATNGSAMTQLDPSRWAETARELLAGSMPKLIRTDTVHITFRDAASEIRSQDASTWNRTWIKKEARSIADAPDATSSVMPMAARWNLGEGEVVATAFGPGASQVEAIANLIARKPHDPRYRVSWQSGATVHVVLDATEPGRSINEARVTLELLDQSAPAARAELTPMEQTAPGKYEASVPAPRSSRLATVRVAGQAIERVALPGRYAAEFEALGNDHTAMEELARKSGGRVISPAESGQLKINWPPRSVQLASETALAGAVLLLAALCRWRMS
ncbi:MAG TPA: vWA domain-containing protein [Tepidisphaeraceae bacterium]